jgi:hypothetical protein
MGGPRRPGANLGRTGRPFGLTNAAPAAGGSDFQTHYQDAAVTIDVAGTVAPNGGADVRSVTVQDANGVRTYNSLEEVPPPYQEQACLAVERYLARRESDGRMR